MDLPSLLLLGILSASIHWLLARAHATAWFWSRLSGWPAVLVACPSCSGFWIGLGLGGLGVTPVETVAGPVGRLAAIIISAILAMFLTPVFQAVMLWGLEKTAIGGEAPTLTSGGAIGTVLPRDPDAEPTPPSPRAVPVAVPDPNADVVTPLPRPALPAPRTAPTSRLPPPPPPRRR